MVVSGKNTGRWVGPLHPTLHCVFFPASTGLGVCDPSRVCLMFADKGLVCEKWDSSCQDPLWLWVQLQPWVLGLVEKCQPRSHVGCLPLFQVFYSEVGVDKSLQERSYGVPPSLNTPTSVSSSIPAAPQKHTLWVTFHWCSEGFLICCVCAAVMYNNNNCLYNPLEFRMSFLAVTPSYTSLSSERQPYEECFHGLSPPHLSCEKAATLQLFFTPPSFLYKIQFCFFLSQ